MVLSVDYRTHPNLEYAILQLFHFFLVDWDRSLLNILFLDPELLVVIVSEVEFLDLLQVLWPLRVVLLACSLCVILANRDLTFGGGQRVHGCGHIGNAVSRIFYLFLLVGGLWVRDSFTGGKVSRSHLVF